MKNDCLKSYERGEWILYDIGEHNLGLGEISSIEVKGSNPEDVTFHLRIWTGPCSTPKASDVLCNVSKQGTHNAYLIWRGRKMALVEELCQEAKQFTCKAFDTLDREANYKLSDMWYIQLDSFLKRSENMVNVYMQLENIKKEKEK